MSGVCGLWRVYGVICLYGPAKEVRLFDVGGGVAVAAVSVLVVEAALSQDDLILRDRLFTAEAVEANRAAPFLLIY